MPVRILLVNDEQVFRSFLRRLLEKEQEFSVVGEAGDGLEAAMRIKAERSQTKVIIFTQYQEDAYRQAATECGVESSLGPARD